MEEEGRGMDGHVLSSPEVRFPSRLIQMSNILQYTRRTDLQNDSHCSPSLLLRDTSRASLARVSSYKQASIEAIFNDVSRALSIILIAPPLKSGRID